MGSTSTLACVDCRWSPAEMDGRSRCALQGLVNCFARSLLLATGVLPTFLTPSTALSGDEFPPNSRFILYCIPSSYALKKAERTSRKPSWRGLEAQARGAAAHHLRNDAVQVHEAGVRHLQDLLADAVGGLVVQHQRPVTRTIDVRNAKSIGVSAFETPSRTGSCEVLSSCSL